MTFSAELWGRFRRWLHLLRCLFAIPVALLRRRKPTIHRAETLTQPIIFMAQDSGRSLALNETVLIGCTCGKVFAQEYKEKEGQDG